MIKPYSRNMEILDPAHFPPNMHRIAMGVEYSGRPFHGFQAQASGVPTVQQALEKALTRICHEPVTLVCAGRTDAGVHATGQVIHFDTLAQRPQNAWLRGVNTQLPAGVSIRWASQVSPAFHARFSARARTYRYVIYNAQTPSALLAETVTWDRRRLDIDAMQQGSRYLLGEHNFNAFRGAGCQANNPVRRIDRIAICRQRDFIVIEVVATAFLYHMVRNIVGVLLAVATGAKQPLWVQQVLASQDRRCADVTAPAAGLYLVNIQYDDATFNLPKSEKGPYLLAGLLDLE